MNRLPALPPLLLAAALLAAPAVGQPEIVPAEHPVYEYLHQHRVRGLLPEYRHEWRPLGRARLETLFDSLDARTMGGSTLDSGTRAWHERLRREITEPPEAVESIVQAEGQIELPRRRESVKYLYYHRDEDWRIALSAVGRLEARLADDEGSRLHSVSLVPEGILQGNYRGFLGFYTGTFNGFTVGGDARALAADPRLAPLYYVARSDPPQGNFDRSTASVRVAGDLFSGEIGHARLLAGASFADPLILAENSDYFSYLRLGVESRVVQYAFMHASLGEQSQQIIGDGGAGVLVGPQRYMAFHRLTLNPWHWLQLAFTEMVIYGQRGPELAYLNPVYPIKPAEHALWDRDNANFTLEFVARPVRGIETYGTAFVADLDTRLLGENSYNNKWAIQAGAGGTIGPAMAYVEYTRIEPFVYTHRFQLDGSFYNSYTHNGFGLGHPLGPNTDQWLVGLRAWLPGNIRGELQARFIRRGENYVDAQTGEFINVGGDIRDGRQPPFTERTKRFLAGDLFQGPGARARLAFEPIQNVGLTLLADYQQWDRGDPARLFARLEVEVAF
jgi:hypothetical protein